MTRQDAVKQAEATRQHNLWRMLVAMYGEAKARSIFHCYSIAPPPKAQSTP